MPHRFDATLKEILSPRPEDFAAVFSLPHISPAQPLNVDLSTISAATDVAFGFGAPIQEIVDLNFQSGPDARNEPAPSLQCGLSPPLPGAGTVRPVATPAEGGRERSDRETHLRLWRQTGRI